MIENISNLSLTPTTKGGVWDDEKLYNKRNDKKTIISENVYCVELKSPDCCSEKEYDMHVLKGMLTIRGNYRLFGRNCSDWAAEVIDYANKKCKE